MGRVQPVQQRNGALYGGLQALAEPGKVLVDVGQGETPAELRRPPVRVWSVMGNPPRERARPR